MPGSVSLLAIPEKNSTFIMEKGPVSSLRDGAAHGFYSGITDTIFPAMLTFAGASAALFNFFAHAGNAAVIIFQWHGARKTSHHRAPKSVLSFAAAMQAALLFSLFALLLFTEQPGNFLCVAVCAVSILSISAGNYAAPMWHAIWAALLPVKPRMAHIALRSKLMTIATLLSLSASALLFNYTDTKTALMMLLFSAAVMKVISSVSIGTDPTFPESSSLRELLNSKAISEASASDLLVFCPFYLSLGIATGFLIPYLGNLKFTVQDIFFLSAIQFLGQIFSTSFLRKSYAYSQHSSTLVKALFIVAILPLCWCVAETFLEWSIIFFLAGMALAIITLGTTQLVHDKRDPLDVAKAQAYLTICMTVSMLCGGIIGGLFFHFSWFTTHETFLVLFSSSAILRTLSVFPIRLGIL